MIRDFYGKFNDLALFLPAISKAYFGIVKSENWKYNFLDRSGSECFFHPYCLTTVNDRIKVDKNGNLKGRPNYDMFDKSKFIGPNKKFFLFGDSGGYQIRGNTLLHNDLICDWKNPNHIITNRVRKHIYEWLWTYADVAPIIDIPSSIVNSMENKAKKPGFINKSGITTQTDALAATIINVEYCLKNKPSESHTRFLNVLQGNSQYQCQEWYNGVKEYSDPNKTDNPLGGWAFGGLNRGNAIVFLERLLKIMDDGLLIPGIHDWIHVLGNTTLSWSIFLSAVQQALRTQCDHKDMTISFDSLSPLAYVNNKCLVIDYKLSANNGYSFSHLPELGIKIGEMKENLNGNLLFKDEYDRRYIQEVYTLMDSTILTTTTLNDLNTTPEGFDQETHMIFYSHNIQAYLQAFVDLNNATNCTFRNSIYAAVNAVFSAKTYKERMDEIYYWSCIFQDIGMVEEDTREEDKKWFDKSFNNLFIVKP